MGEEIVKQKASMKCLRFIEAFLLVVDGCLLLVYLPSPLETTCLGESGMGLGVEVYVPSSYVGNLLKRKRHWFRG